MRAPYCGIRRGIANPVICGRKFCAICGRYRLLVDFRSTASVPRSYCHGCERRCSRAKTKTLSAAERQRKREYQRFWCEGKRRRAGIPPRAFRHRKSVVDRSERIFLAREPLVAELAMFRGRLGKVAARAGVPERSLLRIISGESAQVRLDVADKLAVGMGIPLSLIYPECWD